MRYSELIEEYKDYLKNRNFADTTINLYISKAGEIFKYISEVRGIRRVQDIRREDIKAYQDEVYVGKRQRDNKPLSISSKGGKIIVLKNLFKYLVKSGQIIYNPADDVEVPRVSRKRVREVLKQREVRRLIDSIDISSELGIRDRAMIEILYSTGMRNSELRGIKVNDIDLDREEVIIREGKGYFGARQRVVPIGKVAVGYLEEYLIEARPKLIAGKEQEYVFVNYKGDKMGMDVPTDTVKKYAEKAKIKKKVVVHTLRHSCATHFLNRGADIRYVQELLGHESLDSTRVYTEVEIGDLKRAHRKYHPREMV